MTTIDIVRRIDDVINDTGVDREAKIAHLKGLAEAYWKVVFSELHTPAYASLTDADRKARWERARREADIDSFKTCKKIFYVLDWPGTGGDFYWVR